ncbi:MAG TPA: PEP-CTERM sorting domain-containing protein [Candidatus Paceibacterota bacterium]|nr:PEP-CTERM sorting domain-containing protein [Candidatus Paceibacterota bacterium]
MKAAYLQGLPDSQNGDLWFREGVVPEPSSFALLLLCGGLVAWFRKRN